MSNVKRHAKTPRRHYAQSLPHTFAGNRYRCVPGSTQRSRARAATCAVEITVGSKWDQGKPPQEQPFFREHSSNLKRLRDAGALIVGARYSDKGLVVIAAQDEASARAMMDEDPSIKAEIFKYQIHPFSVFYGGTINTRARKVAQ